MGFDLRSLIRNETFTETDRVLNLPLVQSLGQEAIDYGETFRIPGGTWQLKVPQAEALYSIHKFGGAVLALGVGIGKQQPVDTRVLTPTGWTTIGALSVGDFVVGSDGNPTRVVGIYPQGVKPSYRVTFSDHSSVEAGPDHLWTIQYVSSGGTFRDVTLTTEQLRNPPVISVTGSNGQVFNKDLSKSPMYLPMLSGPVKFYTSEELPLEPYLLGMLIANGSLLLNSGGASLTCNTADKDEVISRLGSFGAINIYGNACRIGIPGITNQIRALGLNVKSNLKFIPRAYFLGSVEQRISLLQGLMDGDGSCSKTRNRLSFSTTSCQLSADVQELIESLGGTCSVTRTDRTLSGRGIEFTLRLRLPSWVSPFSVTRKAIRYLPGSHSHPVRTVVSVDYVRDFDSVCIEVEAADHLYVTEHCILTHNTLVAWLAGRAAGASTVVILMRKSDEKSYLAEVAKYKQHFDPGQCVIHVVPYSQLSNPNFNKILLDLAPDLIVADEAQSLLGDSARSRRFWSYMRENPATTLVVMSGTLIKDSVANAAGLSELALGVRSPLPHTKTHHLETWSNVLDPSGRATSDERAWFNSRVVGPMGVDANAYPALEAARLAAGRRFVQSQGVVFTAEASTQVPLTIERVDVPLPDKLAELIAKVRSEKVSPNGEEVLETDMQVATVSRMLACGFYTRWAWEQVPGGRDEEWLARRSAWGRSLRSELANNHRTGYDSPKLISDRLLAECILDPSLPKNSTLHYTLWSWLEVSHRPAPPTVPVWVDTFLIDYVLEKYKDERPIFWYTHQAIEQELVRRGVDCYGAGTFLDGPERAVGASIQVHGTGRNLQAWNRSVVLELMTDGLAWEQLLGRLHRQGQERPVKFDLMNTHEVTKRAIASAVENAKFIQAMQMTPQRLLTATWV